MLWDTQKGTLFVPFSTISFEFTCTQPAYESKLFLLILNDSEDSCYGNSLVLNTHQYHYSSDTTKRTKVREVYIKYHRLLNVNSVEAKIIVSCLHRNVTNLYWPSYRTRAGISNIWSVKKMFSILLSNPIIKHVFRLHVSTLIGLPCTIPERPWLHVLSSHSLIPFIHSSAVHQGVRVTFPTPRLQ